MRSAREVLAHPDDWPMYGKGTKEIEGYLAQGLQLWRDTLVPKGGAMQGPPLPPGADPAFRAAVTTADVGAYNTRYGPIVTAQFFRSMNAFGAQSKRGYEKGGHRIQSLRSVTGSIGQAELANVPTSVEPTYVEVAVPLKEVMVSTEVSTRMRVVMGKDDTVTFEGVIQDVLDDMMHEFDVELLQDFDTLAVNNPESIDRMTASTALRIAVSYTDGDEDWAGLDRSANAFWDGYVNHNSDVDRLLTQEEIDKLYANLIAFWGKNLNSKIYLTGPQLWTTWSQIVGAKQRLGAGTFTNKVSGVTPVPGDGGGFKLNTYDNFAIVLDENIAVDTLDRLYMQDLLTSAWVMGKEFDATSSSDLIVVGRAASQTVFYGAGELWNWFPRASGQARDFL